MRVAVGIAAALVTCLPAAGSTATAAHRAPGDGIFYVGTCHRNSFDTIQSAVDAAAAVTAPRPPGGVEVAVCPGEYHENVKIRRQRDLTLRSVNPGDHPVIVAAADDPAVAVRGSTRVSVRGFYLREGARTTVRVIGSRSTQLLGNSIENGVVGVLATASPDLRVRQNRFEHDSDAGLVVADSAQPRIRFNYVTKNGAGVRLLDSTAALVEGNYVVNAGQYGLLLDGVTDSLLYDNTTDRNDTGLALVASSGNTIRKQFGERHPIAGVSLDVDSTDNLLKNSVWVDDGTDAFEAVDSSIGDGTAGTANTWIADRCATSQPAGLCGD